MAWAGRAAAVRLLVHVLGGCDGGGGDDDHCPKAGIADGCGKEPDLDTIQALRCVLG